MAKRLYQWNADKYRRWIKDGRGQGTLAEYKPWLTVHDFPSKGRVSRTPGRTTNRPHHFFSKYETAYFYILDFSDIVLDIQEQYPLLPVTETTQLAERLQIRHPRDTVSKYPYVLTSDFVITTSKGTCVRSVKPSEKLADKRTREKLELERRCWKDRGITDWKIVTEKQIDFEKSRNIEWVYRSWYYSEMLPECCRPEEVEDYFLHLYHTTIRPVVEIARRTEENFGLRSGMGITTYQHLLLKKRITVDMSYPPDLQSVRIESRKGGANTWLPIYA